MCADLKIRCNAELVFGVKKSCTEDLLTYMPPLIRTAEKYEDALEGAHIPKISNEHYSWIEHAYSRVPAFFTFSSIVQR